MGGSFTHELRRNTLQQILLRGMSVWSLIALLATASTSASAGVLYGTSPRAALLSINLTDGLMTNLTVEHPNVLQAQGLSAIDTRLSRLYTVGVDKQSLSVILIVYGLSTGNRVRTVVLPFESTAIVGLGEAIEVDPLDGTLVLMGHDPTRGGHHAVYTADPQTFALSFVADLGGDNRTDLFFTSSAYDHDAKMYYVGVAFNSSITHKPTSRFDAVHIPTGQVEQVNTTLMMSSLVYDSPTKRIYGTHVQRSRNGAQRGGPKWEGLPPWEARVAAPYMSAPMASEDAAQYRRSLAFFDTARRTAITDVAPLELTTQVGQMHAFDRAMRVHYPILLGKLPPNASLPYEHTDFCADHNEACPTGSSCCCEPPCRDKERYGYCYAVDSCAEVPPPGDPLHVPAYIYGVHLDSGARACKTKLCSLEPSAATVPAQCPWSLEAMKSIQPAK